MSDLLLKLSLIKDHWEEIAKQIVDPDVIADMKRYVKLTKEYKDLEPLVEAHAEYKNVLDNIQSSQEIIKTEKDPEFKEMAQSELEELTLKQEELEADIKVLLIPKDPEDAKNSVVEIRAGTGGDEASIFAGDLFRMYTKYCESRKWSIEVVDFGEGTSGGYKDITFNVNGVGTYGVLVVPLFW